MDNVNTNKGNIIGLIFVFLTGCIVGAIAGGSTGYRYGMAFILNESLSKDARQVGSHISILRHMRNGEQDLAVEQFEDSLNDILIGFDPHTPYSNLDDETVIALRHAIDEAREYRSTYPRPAEQQDFRDEMVRKLFSRELYQ